jgi:hypothetical protein
MEIECAFNALGRAVRAHDAARRPGSSSGKLMFKKRLAQ